MSTTDPSASTAPSGPTADQAGGNAVRPYVIDDLRQLRALKSPARQEVVDAVQAAGPLSVADLGAMLGRAPDSLYYHVRALLKLGLLVEADQDGQRGLMVDVPGRPVQIRYRVDQPARVRALTETVASMLRLTTRDFRAAIAMPGIVTSGPDRNLWAGRSKARLRPAQMRRLMELLREANDLLATGTTPAAAAEPDGASLVALTFVLTPLAPRRSETKAANGGPRSAAAKGAGPGRKTAPKNPGGKRAGTPRRAATSKAAVDGSAAKGGSKRSVKRSERQDGNGEAR